MQRSFSAFVNSVYIHTWKFRGIYRFHNLHVQMLLPHGMRLHFPVRNYLRYHIHQIL